MQKMFTLYCTLLLNKLLPVDQRITKTCKRNYVPTYSSISVIIKENRINSRYIPA